LERFNKVTVIHGDFGWSDIGSWDALGEVFPPDENGNIVKADHIGIGTKDSIIYGNSRLLATVGIEGLIVVETDDTVLVCRKDRAQDVKKVVEMLERDGRSQTT
jgi:mannose-1-phosphate guanylyltransferase